MSDALLPVYARYDLAFTRGEGSWLVDTVGKRYLDFTAGIGVCALGHGNASVLNALCEQAKALWHVSNLYRIPQQERLAEALVGCTFADKVFFTNSGAEALECAIKGARKYHSFTGHPERYRIIAFSQAFHGRTMATIAAGGQKKLIAGFGPMLEGFDHVPFADIDAVESLISPASAAVLVEPVQGEGGIHPLAPESLKALRDICDENGLLLLLDEVQCGMGRTGRLFAHEWANIAPDIMAIGKGIGSGFPLGACLFAQKAASGMRVGSHGTTYGGNPLACAVGSAVLAEISRADFLAHVRAMGARLREGLDALRQEYPDRISEVRGAGLMLGLACRRSGHALLDAARAQGLLLAPAAGNVIRLLPPLNVSEAEISEAIARLRAALARLREASNEP